CHQRGYTLLLLSSPVCGATRLATFVENGWQGSRNSTSGDQTADLLPLSAPPSATDCIEERALPSGGHPMAAVLRNRSLAGRLVCQPSEWNWPKAVVHRREVRRLQIRSGPAPLPHL